MPYFYQIQQKSNSVANQPQGAWYRGTLHFGIELNRIIEQAGDVMLPDTSSLLSEINWNDFITFMTE
jgi:hypothetical protein